IKLLRESEKPENCQCIASKCWHRRCASHPCRLNANLSGRYRVLCVYAFKAEAALLVPFDSFAARRAPESEDGNYVNVNDKCAVCAHSDSPPVTQARREDRADPLALSPP